jgi:hypothetical protein
VIEERADGCQLVSLTGMSGNNFVVQFNTNLAGTNRVNLLTLPNLSTSPYRFLDPFMNIDFFDVL